MKNYIQLLKSKEIEKDKVEKLENLIAKTDGIFKIIDPVKNLFKFPYVLYIPNNIENNTLILHGNNLAHEEGNILNIYSAIFETTIEAGYDLLSLNQPILVPVTSNYIHPANNNMHEFFPMQASRNVVFCKDEKNTYYKLFSQINNMIDHSRSLISKEAKSILEEKIICHGFSSSAKFVLRYSTCYPERVKLLIAGGFGNQNIIPLSELYVNNKKIDLIYPIGIKDVKEITGKEFDYKAYKEMFQFYFIGENEDSTNDTAFNFRHTDLEIQNIYKELFGTNYQERYNQILKIFKDLDYSNIEFKRYKDYGHSATPAIDYTTFLINKFSKK